MRGEPGPEDHSNQRTESAIPLAAFGKGVTMRDDLWPPHLPSG
jgi:hypothetical protein